MSDFRGFVIAAQYGGPDDSIHDHIWALKSIVEARMRQTRSQNIESVHMAFRVDGRLVSYGCTKAKRLKLMKKRREAWVDLGVPMSAYVGRTREEIRIYLCECVEAGLELYISRLKKDLLCDSCELLYGDWQAVRSTFLAID